jgi:hypothetical protein
MKYFEALLLAVSTGIVLTVAGLALAIAPARAEAPPVVLELFTSQGCSSCPAADALLGELARRPGVLALAFHVDYWNRLGWADPFSSAAATARQAAYVRRLAQPYAYTPELVANGSVHAVGSDRDAVERLLADAGAGSRGPAITVRRGQAGDFAVHIGGQIAGGEGPAAVLWLVRFDRRQVTPVARGENGGRTLTNYQIVRTLEPVGAWQGAALELTVPGLSDERSGSALLLQQDGTGPILAAALLQ